MRLIDLMSGMIVATSTAYKLVDQTILKLDAVHQAKQEQARIVFQQLGLVESENVDLHHPLYAQVTEAVINAEVPVLRSAVQVFRSTQISSCLKGTRITYAERKFLEYWLVKP